MTACAAAYRATVISLHNEFHALYHRLGTITGLGCLRCDFLHVLQLFCLCCGRLLLVL